MPKGHVKYWNHPKAFARWLLRITSPIPYLERRGMRDFLFQMLSGGQRQRALARIESIQPGSRAKLLNLRHSDKYERRRRKKHITTENALHVLAKKHTLDKEIDTQIEESVLALAQRNWEDIGATHYKFVPAEGVINVIACLRAAGYPPGEIATKLNVDLSIVLNVPASLVSAQRKNFNEAIVTMMDQKVLHDGITGNVDADTERADRIAGRRRKLYLDALKLKNDQQKRSVDSGLTPSEVAEKRRMYKERFGITIEAEDEGSKPTGETVSEKQEK